MEALSRKTESTQAENIYWAPTALNLKEKILKREAKVGVIGLGYVGLPLANALVNKSFPVTGFDSDENKVDKLKKSQSYIKYITSDLIAQMNDSGYFRPTSDKSLLKETDVIIICVPTPLTKHREPDMSYVVSTAESILPFLRKGHMVILESTTYPGTTEEVMKPILERSGLKSGQDFYLAYSPEREDPGNVNFNISSIPKVVGGDGANALELAVSLYQSIAASVVPVSSTSIAEAVKITENIFRSVNIALVNELKIVFEKMGIDVWEVIDAAKSKPFGYMPFYPGPGLGGHCIPIDPFYLTWKAHEYGIATRFIELAGQINTSMPLHVVQRLAEALDHKFSKGLRNSKILIIGIAYKKNVDDMRESPALEIIEILKERGATVSYFDSYIPEIEKTREHPELTGMQSIDFVAEDLQQFDAALICADHDDIDFDFLVKNSCLVLDTRNATKSIVHSRDKIFKA